MALFKFINLGGPLNWGIFLVAVLCAVIICERGVFFFQTRKTSPKAPVLTLRQKAAAISHLDPKAREDILALEANVLVHKMSRHLWILHFFSHTAPTLGLLGTITGLMNAFSAMASTNAMDLQIFAGGIWEAMLTTAFGLVVAIPVSFAHRLFLRLIEKRVFILNLYGQKLLEGENSSGEGDV